jgi:hypothetical protein
MAISYGKDEAARRVTFTVVGELTLKDLTEAADRQAAENAWSYALLLDASGRTGPAVSAPVVRTFAEHTAKLSFRYGLPGPFAVVVRDDVGYRMGRMFEVLSGSQTERLIKICRSLEEAQAWLKSPTAPSKSN